MLLTKSKSLITLVFFLQLTKLLNAQQNETLIAEFKMSTKDGKLSSTLHFVINQKDYFDGYFVIPELGNAILGKSGRGGYDFMNYKAIGNEWDFLLPYWVENNSELLENTMTTERQNNSKPLIGDLEGFVQGPNIKTAISFQIKPVYSKNKKSSQKIFAAKFTITEPKRKTQYSAYDMESSIKMFYKALRPDSSGILSTGFIEKALPNYTFFLTIKSVSKSDEVLLVSSKVFEEIKKSVRSVNTTNTFELTAELGVYPPTEIDWMKDVSCFLNHEQNGFIKKNYIISKFSNDTLKLEQPIYYAHLKFPFKMFNEEKEKLFNEFKTKEEVFSSSYEIILIPINYQVEKLTVDVIMNYSKLDVDDEISRWSPFKKRVVFDHDQAIIDMPQENWSAVFVRGGDKYEIYGYSDYEKYISEMLFITLNKVY